jgi:hypothetical protein
MNSILISVAVTISVAILGATVTILGGIIAAAVTFIQGYQIRIHERKLGVLTVLLEAAYKEYEYRTNQDLAKAEKNKTVPKIKSFTEYIFFYSGISEVLTEGDITPKDIENTLIKNKILIDAYYTNRELHKPAYHEQPDIKIPPVPANQVTP